MKSFELKDRVVIITGGGGLLGEQHARAVSEFGATPVLIDQDESAAKRVSDSLPGACPTYAVDITREAALFEVKEDLLKRFGHIDVLVNNAARNPKVGPKEDTSFSRLENFPLEQWHLDLEVGLTGAFLCSKVFGTEMAKAKKGSIINIASDLAVIAPDQRLYRKPGVPEDQQPVKPVSYSVAKGGLVSLTKYLATYWAESGVRVNAISPGGVYNNQPEEFLSRLTPKIPLGRMANANEIQGAVVFLASDAASYVTGSNVVVDGGRSIW